MATFNWGHGIFLFYSFFVAVLVIVVIKSTGFDNSLVTEEYYAKDIAYQREYDRRQNSINLATAVSLDKKSGTYRISFPQEAGPKVSGTLHFYRPSSKNHDRFIPLSTDEKGEMYLSTDGLLPGRYELILEWSAGGRDYLDEFDLTV